MDKQYICKYCGQSFKNSRGLGGHVAHCNKHYECLDLTCKYCSKRYTTLNALKNHEIRCKANPNRIISNIEIFNNTDHIVWNKGLTKLDNESVLQQSLKIKGKTSPFKGSCLSDEHKEKIRKSTIQYIEKLTNKNFVCRYNKNACLFMEELNKQNNWNLQHAENGGEVEIGGYFLDGYDKDLNIAFEPLWD